MTQSMMHPEAMYLYLAVCYHLTWFSWLHRLLSLCPVLPLGCPDLQTYRSALCASYLWKPKTLTVAQPHCVFSHNPWILLTSWKIYAPISICRAVSASLFSPATFTHTLLSPAECGEYTSMKDMDDSFCLALFHLRAAAGRELARAGA